MFWLWTYWDTVIAAGQKVAIDLLTGQMTLEILSQKPI